MVSNAPLLRGAEFSVAGEERGTHMLSDFVRRVALLTVFLCSRIRLFDKILKRALKDAQKLVGMKCAMMIDGECENC